MACTIAGASLAVLIDLGDGPFVLDRDHLDIVGESELTAAEDAQVDIADLILAINWRQGPSSPKGVSLTDPSAGPMTISLIDTTRRFDPLNTSSPSVDFLRPGLDLYTYVDGNQVGYWSLQRWAHDLGAAEATLELTDQVGLAAELDLPPMTVTAGTTAAQAAELVAAAGWPRDFTQTGGSTFTRDTWTWDGGKLLDALEVVRLAERAVIYADNLTGGLGWRGSATPYAPASSAVINCDGVFLESLTLSKNDERVRNVIRLTGAVTDQRSSPSSIATFGARVLAVTTDDLLLTGGIAYADWMDAVLLELGEASILTQLGTMRPVNAEVLTLLLAVDGDRWRVKADEVTPAIDRNVRLWGMSVKATSAGWEVDAVTEDVAAGA